MTKTTDETKKTDKTALSLPDLLKKQSRFSGNVKGVGVPGQKSPTTNFTPPPVRFTQHKGGN